MKVFTRSKTTIMNQLTALQEAIDAEFNCKLPRYRKIQEWEIRFTECAEELATLEIREWRKREPLSF